MNVTSCGNSDAGAPVAALETLPSLQRACATILRVAARLPPALAAARNSVGLSETLREIALSIAAADRLFTGFVCEALTAAGLNVSSFLPLDELLQKLQTEVPAERAGKLLPPGGLVSILYHLEGQLAEVDAGLLALSPDARHTEPAKQSFNLRPQTTMAFLQLAIAAAVALPFVRPFVALITALLWPLAWPVRHWRRRATHARLRHASDQLTCLVRIWTVAHGTIPLHSMGISHDSSHASAASSSSASSRSTTRSGAMASHVPGRSGGWGSSVSTHPGHAAYSSASGSGSGSGVVRRVSFADAEAAAAGDSDSRASGLEGLGGEVAASSSLAAMASVDSIRRARSYLTLVAEPTRHDFEPGSKAVARRLLESASLPRGAAVWPTRTWRNAALKRVLDLIYASTAGPAHLLHPNPVTGAQPGLMQLSLFAVSSLLRAAYFAACPLQASEAAGRALQAPSIPLLTWLWRASDSPFMRRMAMAKAKARGLAVCQEVWVGGVHTMLMCRDSDPALDAACAAAAQPGGEPDSEVRHHADGAPFVIPQLPTHRGASMSAHPPLSSSGSSGSSGSADDGGDGLQSLASERGRGASLVEAEFDESHLRSASSSGGGAGAHRRRHHHRDGNKKLHPPGSEDVVDDPAADPAHRDASGPSIASHDVTTLTRPVSSAASHTRTGALPSRLPRALMHINGGGFVGRSFAPDVDMLAEWAMTAPSPSLASSTSGPRGHSAAAAAASAGPLLIAYPRYSLSPEVTFPTALLELVRVYIWLRERCETVVVSGESAGGNLAAALSIYCLWHGLPLPDALVLAYPALVLNPSPSPSRVSAMRARHCTTRRILRLI